MKAYLYDGNPNEDFKEVEIPADLVDLANEKRELLKWDEYFMGIALLSAERSKDPNTSVGACIVSENNKILSLGYNGMPVGCPDDDFLGNVPLAVRLMKNIFMYAMLN